MTFRGRLTLVAAVAVAVAVAMASVAIFLVVRAELRGQMDTSLRGIAGQARVTVTPFGDRVTLPTSAYGGASGYAQILEAGGGVNTGGGAPIPVSQRDRAVAAGQAASSYEDATVNGIHIRVFTTPLPQGAALQVARPLTEVDQTLRRLVLVLVVVTATGIAVAAVLGTAVTRTAIRPVAVLTETAEYVTSTGDLSRRIDVPGADEVSRLAAAFNQMLGALQASVAAQRQLVADASHELRTPLTSLRTNIEVLERGGVISDEDRRRLLADVRSELEELTVLVADLVELGRGSEPVQTAVDVRLDQLVATAVGRAAARQTRVRFEASLEPCVVQGVPERLERAIVNLLDNAAKFSPAGSAVQVTLRGGELTVRDHGPGIAADDLPKVFDRFYRAPAARGTPGSGLGLAIVRQVAESHGGTVAAEPAPGGGARFRLRLPAVPAPPVNDTSGLSAHAGRP